MENGYDMTDGWERFCKNFDDAVDECAEKGIATRLNIALEGGSHPVTVDVYTGNGAMEKLTRLVTNAVTPQVVK